MRIFDLHCDTLSEIYKNKTTLENSGLSVDLKSMEKYERFVRFFAVFIPENLTVKQREEYFENLYSAFLTQQRIYDSRIKCVKNADDFKNSKCAAILSLENSGVLSGDISKVKYYADKGVKLASFTWNGENELGYGQLENRGLKHFGKLCVTEYEKNNITIDVSHLSDKGFDDVCALSTKPFIASHSNCRSVCNVKRNLTDEQIKEIIRRKGLIGINFYKAFLNNDLHKANKYDIIKHIEHILELSGENVISLGTDFDGADVISEFKNDVMLENLYELLLKNGYSHTLCDKILFSNAYDFFCKNMVWEV